MNPQPELLTWHDTLTIAAIIFAITQFMETTRLRKYLFYLGCLRTITVILVGMPILLIIIANAPPIALVPIISSIGNILGKYFWYIAPFSFPFRTIISCSITPIRLPKEFLDNAIWFISNPIIYQVIALSLFSLLIMIYLWFLQNPQAFRPRFNSKLLDKFGLDLLDNLDHKDLAAICSIIGSYLDKIISLASTVPKYFPEDLHPKKIKNEEIARRCLEFIDVDLSGDNFIIYISRQHIRFVVWTIKTARKYSLWNAGGNIFFDNLFNQLLKDKNSVLTKELKLGGYSGIAKPLTNQIFKSMEIIDNYDVFGALGWGIETSEIVLTNIMTGLEISLKEYFTTDSRSYIGNPSMKLGNVVDNLASCYESLCMSIADKNEEIWKSTNASKASHIMRFFVDLEHILTPSVETRWRKAYSPVFSNADLEVQKYSLSEGIVDAYFKLYEGIAWIKQEEYARMQAIEPYWLVFTDNGAPMIKAVQEKLLEKIKERVDENFKDHYASMIKLFLNLYSGSLIGDNRTTNNPIFLYFQETFKSRIAPELRKNKKFRERNMPQAWFIDKRGSICRNFYGKKEIIVAYSSHAKESLSSKTHSKSQKKSKSVKKIRKR